MKPERPTKHRSRRGHQAEQTASRTDKEQKGDKTDRRLLGTWRSDRRRTVAEWRFFKPVSPKNKRTFLAIFGKLEITYSRKYIRGIFDDYRFRQPYEVLASDSDSVAILYFDKDLTHEWCIRLICFDGKDRFWIPLGGNREWFKRVPKVPPPSV
jgi:hypothetical protein